MTRRILPRDEYPRLIGTYLEPLMHVLPADTDVIVVEDTNGAIVGCSSVFARDHIEGSWIAEAHRGHTVVARHLLKAIRDVARRRGTDRLITASMDALMTQLLDKLGAEALPGTHYVWPIGKDS